MIQPIHIISSNSSSVTSEDTLMSGSYCDSDDAKKRIVTHNYHDHSQDSPNQMDVHHMSSMAPPDDDGDCHESYSSSSEVVLLSNNNNKRRGPRGGVAQPFPEKLFLMLETVDRDDVVSWQPHGRCFVVHKPKEFVSEIMPIYFRQSKLTSFQRQLNLYGFCRLTSGKDRGGYYHELFLRFRPFLCKRMMRTRIKGTGIKAASSPQTEPNFYQMPFLTECPNSQVEFKTPCTMQQHDSVPSLISAMVTPIPTEIYSTPSIDQPTALDDKPHMSLGSLALEPKPDTVITFEGQQFHYLDPLLFLQDTTKLSQSKCEWPGDDLLEADLVMV